MLFPGREEGSEHDPVLMMVTGYYICVRVSPRSHPLNRTAYSKWQGEWGDTLSQSPSPLRGQSTAFSSLPHKHQPIVFGKKTLHLLPH